jgi:hypothetical protein
MSTSLASIRNEIRTLSLTDIDKTSSRPAPFDTQQAAAMIVEAASQSNALIDVRMIEAHLDGITKINPHLADVLHAEIVSKLSPLQQGELGRIGLERQLSENTSSLLAKGQTADDRSLSFEDTVIRPNAGGLDSPSAEITEIGYRYPRNTDRYWSEMYRPGWPSGLTERVENIARRSVIYDTLDRALSSPGTVYRSNFFGAASSVTGIVGLTGGQITSTVAGYPFDATSLRHIQRLGADLYQYVNVPLFNALYDGNNNFRLANRSTLGSLTRGTTQQLDYALVRNEQTHVQRFLDRLPEAERRNLISQSNEAMSLSPSPTVREAIRGLGEPFDFGNQSHREAIGRAMVNSYGYNQRNSGETWT